MTPTPYQRFLRLLKVDKQEIFSIYIYALFNGLISLSLPLGIQAIINLIGGGQTSTAWIVLVIFVIAGIAIGGVMQIMQLSITENLQQKIFTRSAFEFAYRIPRLQLDKLDRVYIPELVNRFFDTLSVQKGLSKILMDFSSASLLTFFGLVLLSIYHPFFIIFSILLVIILYIIFKLTIPQGMRTSLRESRYKYEVAHWLEELARAMETFKLAGNSPLPLSRTDEVVEDYLGARKAHFRTLLMQYINLVGFKVIIAAALLVIGGLLVINQQMNIGQFVASEIIIILVINSVEKLMLSMETIYDVLTSLEKIGSVTDLDLESEQESTHAQTFGEGLSLELNDLSFKFPDSAEDIISGIDLKIPEGQKVCLTGFEGSGKSLLLQMMAGLYTNFRGAISYEGIPLASWNKPRLRSMIGDSLAREDLFRGTLAENVSLGKTTISQDRIQKAIEVVGLTEYVQKLPEGYDTEIFPEGKNLPRNVRLKIMLARSLTCSSRLLLLDENFNELKNGNKQKFIDHINSLNCTVVAVSNDPDVAKKFEKIVVMDQGKVLGEGDFESLRNKEWCNRVFQKN